MSICLSLRRGGVREDVIVPYGSKIKFGISRCSFKLEEIFKGIVGVVVFVVVEDNNLRPRPRAASGLSLKVEVEGEIVIIISIFLL